MPTYEGVPLTEAILPPEVTAHVPIDITTDQFAARLKDGGKMELVGTTWTIGQGPDFAGNRAAFIALDELILSDATIITNGNVLTIFCNKLVSNQGKIVSFTDAESTAEIGTRGTTSGQGGNSGQPGDSGGVVSIHVIEDIDGTIDVSLHGQNGGKGGDGAQGAQGGAGVKGANAVSDGLWCRAGGQDGSAGGIGFPGGRGGDGGPGGQGGVFYLFQINKAVGNGSYRFAAKGGKGGAVGNPGVGGPGGPGGEGGNGSGACDGGHGGASGPNGSQGDPGTPGRDAGDGVATAKSIDLEVSIRVATAGAVMPPPALR